jgi:hypothetical protein
MGELHTDYDVKGIIQDLRDNKYSDDEIKGILKDKFGDQTVQMHFPSKEDVTISSPAPKEMEMLQPVAIATGGGLAALGAQKLGKKIYDRFIGEKPAKPVEKIEPTFGPIEQKPLTKVEQQLQGVDVNKLPKDQREMVNTLLDAERKRAEKQKQATTAVQQEMKGIIPVQQTPTIAPISTVAPVAPPQAPIQISTPEVPTIAQLGQQATGTAPVAPPATTEQIATEAVEGKKKGRPAGAKNLTEEQRIAQKGGLPGMTKQEAGMRGHLLGMYGGKENPHAQQAYEQVKEILGYTPAYEPGKGGSLKPEETGKIKSWQKENMPGPKITLTHEMKKVLKAGGPAAVAAMVLTPEFANASSAEKRQILGESLLPLGISPSELQSGTLDEKRLRAYQEAQKLGSPYRSVPPPR